MTLSIVAVHGIGAYHNNASQMRTVWTDALRAGLRENSIDDTSIDLQVAHYARLLRVTGEQASGVPENLNAEESVILAMWMGALGLPSETAQGYPTIPLRLACDWTARNVAHSDDKATRRRLMRFMSQVVRDVARYTNHKEQRDAARDEVAKVIAHNQPRVVIAHSLGSVVTYETLWKHPSLKIDLLLTVGSPLALPGAIFDRLQPAPAPNPRDGKGSCPPNVQTWVNIADIGDIVAVPRPLHSWFEGLSPDHDHQTRIGAIAMHGMVHYLKNFETAAALAPYI